MSRDYNPLERAQEALRSAYDHIGMARHYYFYEDAAKHAELTTIGNRVAEQLQALCAIGAK
jgi:hypothetical protein